ncbi:Serine/threonine protein kinase [Parasponia andersonii]|uniref:Serine/threonine protein kinase n=1 Tax=Parasponia andersonii TaxID=3476 RepID=A0A2P5BV41_PARAD|nr:Serine/threonine protein kinase [Parasponia andersonii]
MDPTVEAILACVAVVIIAATIISAVVLKICKVLKRVPNHPTPTSVPNPGLTSVDESSSFHPSLQIISMSEILAATKNFSPDQIIGDSRFGFVYKAELSNGLKLAIKKLHPDAFQGFMEFRSELEILGKLRHRNIAHVLGYCVSGADRILIFELFENGDLNLNLHDLWSSSERNYMSHARFPLSWETRQKIVKGVANGLAYIHGLDKPIIHRDIKSSNVLLDSDFEARISDFGLARTIDYRHSHVSTQAAGTAGYLAPEYEEAIAVATVKGDVYSFGILMLEVATGKRPDLPVDLNGESMSFIEWARDMVAQNQEREILDPIIWVWGRRNQLREANIKEYFRIALMCANDSLKKRPAMRDVVELLA